MLLDLSIGWHAVPALHDDALYDFTKQFLVDGKRPVADLGRVEEGVGLVQQLLARRTHVYVAIQATLKGSNQRWGDGSSAHATRWELDGMAPVDDGLASCHVVGNVAKRRHAIDHLVKDAAQCYDGM